MAETWSLRRTGKTAKTSSGEILLTVSLTTCVETVMLNIFACLDQVKVKLLNVVLRHEFSLKLLKGKLRTLSTAEIFLLDSSASSFLTVSLSSCGLTLRWIAT